MTHDEGAQGAVLDDLGGDEGVGQQRPEECGDGACVDGGEDDEGGGALCEESPGGKELEGEGEEVEDEKNAEFDAAWGRGEGGLVWNGMEAGLEPRTDGSLSTGGEEDEGSDDEDADAAHDDVGDVGYGAAGADEGDAALGVDAHGCGGGIGRDGGEDCLVVALDLGEVGLLGYEWKGY